MNILVVAAPFGFGPSSKALVISERLRSDAQITINTVGDAADFICRHKPDGVAVTRGRFSLVYPARSAVLAFDLIICVNHVPAMAMLGTFGMANRTVFIDSLLPWRQDNEKIKIPERLLAYIVQDYPGIDVVNSMDGFGSYYVSAPITMPVVSIEQAGKKKNLVLHFGGLLSPLSTWKDVKNFVEKTILHILSLAEKYGLHLVVIGNERLKSINITHPILTILGEISPQNAVQLIAFSQMLVTTPGLGGIYEALSAHCPVVLLPPVNSTQLHHFEVFSERCFPTSIPEVVFRDTFHGLGDKAWQNQTRYCLQLVAECTPLLLSGLDRIFDIFFGGAGFREERDRLMVAQGSLYDSLSKVDAIDCLKTFMSNRNTTPRNITHVSQENRIDSARRKGDFARYLLKMPKVELHVHMEGSIRPELLLQMAERNSLRLPFDSVDKYREFLKFRDFSDFSKMLLLGVHCLRTARDFYELVVDLGGQLAAQNIIYAEVSWTPQFYLNRNVSLDNIFAAMNKARFFIKKNMDIDIRWIPDIVRSYPGPGLRAYKWLITKSLEVDGVAALGLAGPEAGYPARPFAPIFTHAKNNKLLANPHAGENAGPESVWEAIRVLSPRRISHGVRSVEDSGLIAYLVNNKIMLEVCPTSNIKLGLYRDYSDHPLKDLTDAGCKVCVNSDDPVLFQTSLAEEYHHAIQDCGLSMETLRQTVFDALDASYLSDDEKKGVHEKLVDGFKNIEEQRAG